MLPARIFVSKIYRHIWAVVTGNKASITQVPDSGQETADPVLARIDLSVNSLVRKYTT